MVLAIQKWIQKHIDRIEELLKTEDRPEIRATLEEMLACNKNVISKNRKPSWRPVSIWPGSRRFPESTTVTARAAGWISFCIPSIKGYGKRFDR